MSEDRHTFSEPRPIPGLELPTWDVDVFRNGVPEPILTLRIDEKTLPPRKSKKKKIVWKLPDTIDQIPRFGAAEKSRLLDLFKNLKKERRKSKTNKQRSGSMTHNNNDNDNDDGEDDDYPAEDDDDDNPEQSERDDIQEFLAANNQNGNKSGINVPGMENMSLQNDERLNRVKAPPPPGGFQPPDTTLKDDQKPLVTNQQLPKATMPPPGMGMTRRNSAPLPPETTTTTQQTTNTTNGSSSLGVRPAISTQPKPPPGMYRSQSLPLDDMPTTNSIPTQSQTHLPPPLPPTTTQTPLPESNTTTANPPQGLNNTSQATTATQQQTSPLSPPMTSPPVPPPVLPSPVLPPVRHLKFPAATMPPDIFAQQVANLYISLLQSGQVDELMLYYTLTAQKSLSLKSAKSICCTPTEMKIQLTSLVGCEFVVQGITVQQGMLNSLLIIWSGVCQLAGQQHGFCQTLILVPLAAPQPPTTATDSDNSSSLQYQIQNDALVLLTND